MDQWIRYTIILVVAVGWGTYIISLIVRGQDIPLALWSVPGGTLALLSDKFPISIRRGSKEEE